MTARQASEIPEWPYGFLQDFWNIINPEEQYHKTVIEDRDEILRSVEYVLTHTKIPARELEMLHMRYDRHLSYTEIGRYYSITGGRVSQILARTLRRIKWKKENHAILAVGISEYQELEQERERKEQEEAQKSGKKYPDPAMPIAELGLPIRAYHCLTRSGLSTIEDILKLDGGESLRKMRNAGAKTCDDIINGLEKKGFDASHLKQ